MTFDDCDYDPAMACDLAEIAQERDTYAAEARALRAQLAAAIAVQSEQANTIGDLQALLDAGGVEQRLPQPGRRAYRARPGPDRSVNR